MREFRWNARNVEHIARHGVTTDEAEYVVSRGQGKKASEGRRVVEGKTAEGHYLRVVFVIDALPAETLYVIHAMFLTDRDKRRYRRRKK